MPALESWILDGVPLTTGAFTLMELTADPPKARADWITAADSENATLIRQPFHENRTIAMKLRVASQTSMDLALDQVAAVVTKLRSASSSPDGIDLVWTPGGSTRSVTFDMAAGEITGLPISLTGDGYSWLLQRPIITVEFTCYPYGRATPLATITDAFAANSIADYTFDAGAAGNVSITGGVMDSAANLTTENRLLHTASPYAVANARVTAKHTLGTTLTSYKAGVILKRVDASNYLEVYVDDTGAASRLRIDRVIAGARTNLVSTALTRMTVSTAYWVRGRIEGNVVVGEHWTSAPTVTGTATSSNTATLAGGDATALGTGITGRCGLVWIPQQTAATLDDLEIAPNVFVSITPIVTGDLVGVPGDVPGEGVLTIIETAAQSRRHVEWGLEGPGTYDASTSLLLDSDSLVTSGFTGSLATTTGAYDPNAAGNNSITATVWSTSAVMCGTGNQSHVGVFRIKARVQLLAQTYIRFTWRAGDGPWTSNDWVLSPAPNVSSGAHWAEVDLGTITVPAAVAGTQRWEGRVEVYDTGTAPGSGQAILDYLELIPTAAGYGKARATSVYQAGSIVAADSFTSTTAAVALNARVAPAGGTWATSGSATDLAFADDLSGEQIKRATTSDAGPRFAILGSTAYTDSQVEVLMYRSGTPFTVGELIEQGVIARWVDSSNYVRATLTRVAPLTLTFALVQRVAGVDATIATQSLSSSGTAAVFLCMRLAVYAAGRVVATVLDASKASVIASIEAASTVLATGGALDDGKPGIYDYSPTASALTRYYDDFSMSTPPAEPIALYSGQTLKVRSDDVIRDDATGVYAGRPPSYRGSRFLVPVGTSRAVVKARRNDIDVVEDANVTDSTTMQILWTPRVLAVPR